VLTARRGDGCRRKRPELGDRTARRSGCKYLHLFNGRCRIDAVLIDQVDAIGSHPLQRRVDRPRHTRHALPEADHREAVARKLVSDDANGTIFRVTRQ
jgi:hypothetical protein